MVWFSRTSGRKSRVEERFRADGVFVFLKDIRRPAIDLSLGGVVFADPPPGLRKGAKVVCSLILPMAIGEREIAFSGIFVRVTEANAAIQIDLQNYNVLMSIRQFIMKQRNEARVQESKSY